MIHTLRKWLVLHIRLLSYLLSISFVTIWTLIRHWSNGVNFDVVGQIGVAEQWTHGFHSGAQFGATNYVFKLPLYFLVNQLGFLNPHLKLLTAALVCNIATICLLIYVGEKLLRLYSVRPNVYFYMAMVWLASISGRVFWLDYANSRNLETVGGLIVLYLGLRAVEQPSGRALALFALMGGLAFFADPLQIYVIGGGLTLYALLLWLHGRTKPQTEQSATLIGGVAGGFVLAKLFTLAATKLLPVSFLVAPHGSTPHGLFTTAGLEIKGMALSTARVFDASFYANASVLNLVRELLNMLVLLGVVTLSVYAWQRSRAKGLVLACTCCILAAYGAYVASYQALEPLTERYIVMVPLLVCLVFGANAGVMPRPQVRWFRSAWIVALAISAVLASGALVRSWPQHYSRDRHIASTLAFLQQNNATVAVSSRDAIPLTYFDEHKTSVLPTICLPDHTVVESNLFFDKAAFAQLPKNRGEIPFIVPAGGISSSGSVCSLSDIEKQFGPPVRQLPVPDTGIALVYRAEQLRSLHD